jgi:hypothetical protein
MNSRGEVEIHDSPCPWLWDQPIWLFITNRITPVENFQQKNLKKSQIFHNGQIKFKIQHLHHFYSDFSICLQNKDQNYTRKKNPFSIK